MQIDIKKLEQLVASKHVLKKEHKKLPLILWKYSNLCQYENMWTAESLRARGLVTDLGGEIICNSMPKFFNLEEQKDFSFLNQPVEIYNKMDGSLIQIFHYNEELIITSSGSFENEYIEKAKHILRNKYDINNFDKDKCYFFELISPMNRIVVNYGDIEDLFLLAVRSKYFDLEYNIDNFKKYFNIVNKIASFDSIHLRDLESLQKRNLQNEEGYIAKFSNNHRVKIKFEEYVKLHRTITFLTDHNIWDNLRSNANIEQLLNTPDEIYKIIEKHINSFKLHFDILYFELESLARSNWHLDRKQFAIKFKDHKYFSVLMAFKNNKLSIAERAIWQILEPKEKNSIFNII